MTSFAATVLLAGVVPALLLLVTLMAAGGAASTASRVVVNTLAVRSTPANRGGATSLTLAWQFLGSALAPVVLLPLYHAGPVLGFGVAAAIALPAAALLALARTS